MEIININGVPFNYEEEHLISDNGCPITEESARKILQLSKDLFEKRGMFFFLWWGTLLGAVRDHGIIPGDEDVDCGITDEKKLIESIPYFYDNGLKIIRHLPGKVYSFRTEDNCYIDFYVIRPLDFSLWSLWCCHAGPNVMEKKHFKRFKEIEFLGGTYLAPYDTDAMLVRLYGRTWRIPQKGHLWQSDVWSYFVWKHYIIPYTKYITQELVGWKYWRHIFCKEWKSSDESVKAFNDWWKRYKDSLKQIKK